MNAKQYEALKSLQGALEDFVDLLAPDEEPVKEKKTRGATSDTAPKTKVTGKKKATPEKEETTEADSLSQEILENMSYNDLKSTAKKLGISAKGDRDTLVNRLLNQSPDVAEDEDEDESAPPAKEKKKTTAKGSKKKTAPVPEPNEEDEDDEDDDGIEDLVLTAVEDMSDEDILDFLLDSGIKAKGKRQALIAAVVKAVRDGKIELEDDGEDEEDEDEDDDSSPTEMTKERANGIQSFTSDTKAQIKSGELSREDMITFINEYHGTKDKMKKVSDKDLLAKYLEVAVNFISDEGEIPDDEDPEAYTVNGVPFCCGYELKYDEEDEQYICESCGNEYPADDEED